MRSKSDTSSCFKIFRPQAEKHTGAELKSHNVIKCSAKSAEELKVLRTDNGGQYVSNEFNTYLREHGIQHQLTVACAPQQNEVAERLNRTLMDYVQSMFLASSRGKKF